MRKLRGLAAGAAFSASLLACTSAASAQAGQVLLGANGVEGTLSSLLEIDPTNGTVVSTGGRMGFAINGLAEDPTTGILYGTTSDDDPNQPGFLVTVNKFTGAATVVGDLFPPLTTRTTAGDITFRSDGTLFGWAEAGTNPDDLVTINKATGAATIVGDSGISTDRGGLDFAPNGTLYLVTDDNDPLRTVNPATGVTTAGPTLSGVQGFDFTALAFDAGGAAFASRVNDAGNFNADIVRIDLTSGNLGRVGGPIGQLDALDFLNRLARTISLEAKPKKVKKGKKTTVSGSITAASECAAIQSVEIQRQSGADFVTVKTVTTDAAGGYSTRLGIERKTTVRAAVSQPAVCEDATSATQKVKIKKEKE
jgi:hypothetical protein